MFNALNAAANGKKVVPLKRWLRIFVIFVFSMGFAKNTGSLHRVVAAVLLMLPLLLSMVGGNVLSSLLATVAGGDVQLLSFRYSAILESLGAFSSLLAFVLLLRYVADRVVLNALRILVAAELYMALYWLLLFMVPDGRPAVAEVLGSSALLVAVIACCYAWSLMMGNDKLGKTERSWMPFMLMPYILSFAAFYATMWQRFVPEGGVALLLDASPLYMFVAISFNILRCVAVWVFANSSLFNPLEGGSHHVSEGGYTPLNRYVLAVALSALFVVNALAWVYENMYLFYNL